MSRGPRPRHPAVLGVLGVLCALGALAVLLAARPALGLGLGTPAPPAQRGTRAPSRSALPTALPPVTTRNTTHCPDKVKPPAAVDSSEVPAPGSTAPPPLPAAATPAGGPRMAECGYVVPARAPPLPKKLDFESWVITDLDTGAVLAARDPHARQRPASCIKILLSMVAIDELDPDAVVTGTHADANQLGSKVGVGPGGQYTVEALLHGLLMQSGNDAAYALAMRLGGVHEAVAKMNALAKRLGAQDTRVVTPSGLDGPGMSTSAYDMSLFFSAAMTKPLFAKIVHTRSYDFPGYGTRSDYEIDNDNRLLGTYRGDLGGKTGYTDDALHTYVNAAERHGHRVALVMMRGMNHLPGMYDNAHKLMNYAFALEAASTAPVGHLETTAGAPSTTGTSPPFRTQSHNTHGRAAGPASHTSASGAAQHPHSRLPELVALVALLAVILGAAGALRARRRRRW